jgi:hypothetical protein
MRLIQLLNVPLSQGMQDLESVLKKRHMFDFTSQAQVQHLWKTPQFTSWYLSESSAVLLVDANFDSNLAGRISPMSLLCAMMAVQLPNPEQKLWLQFFCGQYTRSADPLRGPQGMLRSILTQLLLDLYQRNMMSLSFPDASAVWTQAGPPPIDNLCRMLADLLRSFPTGMTVFCALDGISYFEVQEMAADLCLAVECLRDLALDRSLGARFKLLLTCGSRSKCVYRLVDPASQHVTLRRGQGTQGLNPRTFVGEANRALRRY